MRNSTFMSIRALNFYNKVLWYAESDGVIFVKIVWLLGGISPYFLKWGKFSQARNFWRVRLILMKFQYLKSALKCDSFDVTIGIKIPFFRVLVTIEPGRSLLQFVTTNCLIIPCPNILLWEFLLYLNCKISWAGGGGRCLQTLDGVEGPTFLFLTENTENNSTTTNIAIVCLISK